MRPGGSQSRYGGTNGVGSEETTTAQQPVRSLRRLIGPLRGDSGLGEITTLDPVTRTCASAHLPSGVHEQPVGSRPRADPGKVCFLATNAETCRSHEAASRPRRYALLSASTRIIYGTRLLINAMGQIWYIQQFAMNLAADDPSLHGYDHRANDD